MAGEGATLQSRLSGGLRSSLTLSNTTNTRSVRSGAYSLSQLRRSQNTHDGGLPAEDYLNLLHSVADRGCDLEAKREVWPMLLGVLPPWLTSNEREALVHRLRHTYAQLVQECQMKEDQLLQLVLGDLAMSVHSSTAAEGAPTATIEGGSSNSSSWHQCASPDHKGLRNQQLSLDSTQSVAVALTQALPGTAASAHQAPSTTSGTTHSMSSQEPSPRLSPTKPHSENHPEGSPPAVQPCTSPAGHASAHSTDAVPELLQTHSAAAAPGPELLPSSSSGNCGFVGMGAGVSLRPRSTHHTPSNSLHRIMFEESFESDAPHPLRPLHATTSLPPISLPPVNSCGPALTLPHPSTPSPAPSLPRRPDAHHAAPGTGSPFKQVHAALDDQAGRAAAGAGGGEADPQPVDHTAAAGLGTAVQAGPRDEAVPVPEDLHLFWEAQHLIVLDVIRTDFQKHTLTAAGALSSWLHVALGDVGLYQKLQAADSSWAEMGWLSSIARSHLDHSAHFSADHKRVLARLTRLLSAYTLHDPDIGYRQGMSDLALPFLLVLEDDALAFYCFERLMSKVRANFMGDGSESGIFTQLVRLAGLLQAEDPVLHAKLEQVESLDCHFAYRMIMVLMRRELPLDQTLKLWEMLWADDILWLHPGFNSPHEPASGPLPVLQHPAAGVVSDGGAVSAGSALDEGCHDDGCAYVEVDRAAHVMNSSGSRDDQGRPTASKRVDAGAAWLSSKLDSFKMGLRSSGAQEQSLELQVKAGPAPGVDTASGDGASGASGGDATQGDGNGGSEEPQDRVSAARALLAGSHKLKARFGASLKALANSASQLRPSSAHTTAHGSAPSSSAEEEGAVRATAEEAVEAAHVAGAGDEDAVMVGSTPEAGAADSRFSLLQKRLSRLVSQNKQAGSPVIEQSGQAAQVPAQPAATALGGIKHFFNRGGTGGSAPPDDSTSCDDLRGTLKQQGEEDGVELADVGTWQFAESALSQSDSHVCEADEELPEEATETDAVIVEAPVRSTEDVDASKVSLSDGASSMEQMVLVDPESCASPKFAAVKGLLKVNPPALTAFRSLQASFKGILANRSGHTAGTGAAVPPSASAAEPHAGSIGSYLSAKLGSAVAAVSSRSEADDLGAANHAASAIPAEVAMDSAIRLLLSIDACQPAPDGEASGHGLQLLRVRIWPAAAPHLTGSDAGGGGEWSQPGTGSWQLMAGPDTSSSTPVTQQYAAHVDLLVYFVAAVVLSVRDRILVDCHDHADVLHLLRNPAALKVDVQECISRARLMRRRAAVGPAAGSVGGECEQVGVVEMAGA